jgi:hypothetical protein
MCSVQPVSSLLLYIIFKIAVLDEDVITSIRNFNESKNIAELLQP